jgi:hypothetical protein
VACLFVGGAEERQHVVSGLAPDGVEVGARGGSPPWPERKAKLGCLGA